MTRRGDRIGHGISLDGRGRAEACHERRHKACGGKKDSDCHIVVLSCVALLVYFYNIVSDL